MVEMVPCRINGAYDIVLPAHRAARPDWYTEKGWEKERLAHMKSTTSEGDLVLYAGAEEGEMPALLQMWGAQVWMAEPNELVWPNIRAVYEGNDLEAPSNSYVGFFGKDNSHNWREGLTSNQWPACAYGEVIHDHGFKELRAPGVRPVVAIDSLGATPNMITMDVEGSEWEVLQGAEYTIRDHKPRIYLSLHPEFLIDQYGKYSREVRNWIIDWGYTEELLSWDHEAHFVYLPR